MADAGHPAREAPDMKRLKKRNDYVKVARGARTPRRGFLLQSIRRTEGAADVVEADARFGFTVTKKMGNAVVRNRIRRRLRAAAALALAEQTGKPCDLVVIARPETVQADFTAMVADLSVAFDRARPAGGGKRRSAPRKAS